MAVLSAVAGCGGTRGAYQVELLEDEVAQVVNPDSGKAATCKRKALPKGVKEGDVVVDGRIDRQLSAELKRQVDDLHHRYAVPVPPGFSLEEGDRTPLTKAED